VQECEKVNWREFDALPLYILYGSRTSFLSIASRPDDDPLAISIAAGLLRERYGTFADGQ
jgi:hypothetical protein